MTSPDNSPVDGISLDQIDERRQESEERTRDGQSGPVVYILEYHDDNATIVHGKSTEVGNIAESNRMDIKPIQDDQYTHYAVFRLEDRSTVTIVQDYSEKLYKIFSLGRDTVKIAHPITIREPS